MNSEDKLIAIIMTGIFLAAVSCAYIAWAIFPRVNAEAKVLVLQEANKTLQILISPELSPENKKVCEEMLVAIFGNESEDSDGK